MKKILLSILVAPVFFSPFLALAHGPTDFDETRGSGAGMMRYIEDKALGAETHEELEALMEKMTAGKLTEEEADRVVDFMKQYPGPMGMMMARQDSPQASRMMGEGGWNMMGKWQGSGWAYWITIILSWVFLVLAIAALSQWISKEKKP